MVVQSRWKIIKETAKSRAGERMVLCICRCGVKKVVHRRDVIAGRSLSCGCLKRERTSATHKTHGMSQTSTYKSWKGARDRTANPNNPKFYRYGGRGIRMCERWNNFGNFLKDMGEKPHGKTLDRYPDNDGDYRPGNCRWADPTQQARNTRRNHILEFKGVRLTVAEWSDRTGISQAAIRGRVNRYGWSVADALTMPTNSRPQKEVTPCPLR